MSPPSSPPPPHPPHDGHDTHTHPARTPRSPPAAATAYHQRLADEDHCIPPTSPSASPSPSASAAPPVQRHRSGSRTYHDVVHQGQLDRLALERQKSRERAAAIEALEGKKEAHATSPQSPPPPAAGGATGMQDHHRPQQQDGDMLSVNELRLEMETLLSLRRRSMNQPAAVDPDLPPTSPPTSSPPSAGHTHGVYASTSLGAHEAGAAPTSRPQHSQRPQLTLQLTPPPVEGSTGRPISPTAPSPAETGTLVRRKSSAKTKLPSEHPLPAPPPLPSPSAIHFPSPFGFGSPHEQRAGHATGAGASGAAPGAAGPSGSTSPTSPTSPSAYLDIPLAGGPPSSGSSSSSSSELFWLPASLHPELAPQEFKAFIREQTTPEALARRSSLRSTGGPGAQGSTSPGPGAGPGGGRAGSLGAGGQHRPVRRASLLRGEYKPRQDDGVGEESDERGGGGARPRLGSRTGRRTSGDLKRTASDGSRGAGRRGSVVSFEELTIKDLQRLEELAAKAEAEGTTAGEEEEGERLGRVLRRSLSLNPHRVAAAAAAASAPLGPLKEEGETGEGLSDEAPLIVPPPGQILRRNARTRIRKDSTGSSFGRSSGGGGGGGSRFGGPRRQRSEADMAGEGGTADARASTASAYGGTLEDEAGSQEGHSLEGHSLEGHSLEGQSVEGHSVEGSVSYESEELPPGARAPPVSVESAASTAAPGEVRAPSPPTSSEEQHIEHAPVAAHVVEEPAQVGLPPVAAPEPQPPRASQPEHSAPPLPPPVAPASPAAQPQAETPPALPERPTISPAAAEYDWATHNLQQQGAGPAAPPTPSPPPEPQYHVHPQHLARQPFSEVPPPQAVPLPTNERDRPPSQSPPSPARSDSSKSSGKEKKSGWARLGLGRDEDKGKKKKSGKEDSSGGFLGGLFGRKNREESERPPPRAPSPPPEPKVAPPAPTTTGVLLPDGRYANFYRLPIHVERAVYRLSHIKLANPRRPLYEQVLISNLMFWYLGLIQKPATPPPPAATPVPIPGMRSQSPAPPSPNSPSTASAGSVDSRSTSREPQKRAGLSKPGRGGRTAETPVRGPSFEMQNQQLAEEQRHQKQQHRQQQQSQSPSRVYADPQQPYAPLPSSPTPASGPLAPAKGLFAPPLSSTSVDVPPRAPDRASAPASIYPITHAQGPYEAEQPALNGWQDPTQRGSFPPNRPVPVSNDARPADTAGFAVTSRAPNLRRLSSGSQGESAAGTKASSSMRERRASVMSDKSFDASEIYDAYAPGSPVQNAAEHVEFAGGNAPALSRPAGAAPSVVAPRGSSLKALGGGGGGGPPVLSESQERAGR